jgi:hypothetical protein
MMARRSSRSWLLFILALIGLSVGLFPRSSEGIDPATGEQVKQRSLGLEFSPAYQSVRREWAQPTGFGVHIESGINFISWSMLSILLAAVCLAGWWRARESAPRPEGRHLTEALPDA